MTRQPSKQDPEGSGEESGDPAQAQSRRSAPFSSAPPSLSLITEVQERSADATLRGHVTTGRGEAQAQGAGADGGRLCQLTQGAFEVL